MPAIRPCGQQPGLATRFDPAIADKARKPAIEAAHAAIRELLEGVASLDEDRIVRSYVGVIDATLRTTGVYDLSELTALEGDATRMNAVCCVLDEVGVRLRALARDLAQQAAQLTEEDGATRLTALSAVLNAPLRFGPDGPDSA